MLLDMSAKASEEKSNEEIAFAKFSKWCEMESTNLKQAIKKEGEQIDLLNAEVDKLTSEAAALGKEIAKLGNDITTYEADVKAAKDQRAKDHADFLEESQDYSESVDALDRAIMVLQKQDYDRTGAAAALTQVAEKEIPERAKSLIMAFMGMMNGNDGKAPDIMSYEAPEANGYEFQSGGIIEMLKKLKEDFTSKLGTCQKEEMNSKHAFDMVIADLTDSIENANKDMEEKKEQKERKLEKAGLDKKESAATSVAKAQDEKTLADLTAECAEKTASFKEKQQLRADEIEAIMKAVEILKSPAVTGNAEKHLSFVQTGATSLLQIKEESAASEATNGIRRRVRQFLVAESQRLHSKHLNLLVEKMQADPFAKVKKMIDSMITRLLEEANEDAKHEGFCDKEMGKSKVTRNKLSADIDALTAAIEDGKATIMTLTSDIAELSKEIEELSALMGEATENRKEEKAKNEETIKDATAGQNAVEAATAVLKDFYTKASTATALVQGGGARLGLLSTRGIKMGSEEWEALANPDFKGTIDKGHKEGMQTFGETYTGKQDQAGGVLALLEVIQSDFANLKADTEAAESAAQKAYEDLMTESKKSKAVKEKKVEMNTADKASAEATLQEDIAELKSTQDELLAADRYYEKLVPQCVDQGMTWDERQKARQDEITSLKEALKILGSEDIATSA